MKIAVPADNKGPEAKLDSRFGRAACFAVYNDEKDEYEYASNQQNLSLPQGAGIQSAKSVVDAGADVLIAKNVGPKAYNLLKESGVDIFICEDEVTAGEAVDLYKKGSLKKLEEPNVKGHW